MDRRVNYYKILLNTIYEIGLELNSSSETDKALERALHILADHLEVKNCMIFLIDETDHALKLKASQGISRELAEQIVYKEGEGIVGKVFKLGMPVLIQDISVEPEFMNKINRSQEDTISFLAVPISIADEKCGVLALDKKSSDVFSYEADIDFLKMTSTMISSFLGKMRAIEKEKKELLAEKERLRTELVGKYAYKGLVGNSKVMQEVFRKIEQVKDTKTTVLIRGESGTGKEVVARAIHYSGSRAKKPFIAVNCAAIPKELIESELFGHKKGAFTGANTDKKGKFELADGGTIFLDEIGDMPYEAQSKLLRVLQEMKVEKVGGSTPVKIDVRVIAATNKNLEFDIKEKTFRLDLYYRLNVMSIYLPPLRKRREDIPSLAQNALEKFNKEYGRELRLSHEVYEGLVGCSWPGNIRELENCIERAALSANGDMITGRDLTCTASGQRCVSAVMSSSAETTFEKPVEDIPVKPQRMDKADIPLTVNEEKQMIVDALEKTGWVQAKAARLLGMTVRQVNYRIAKFNIEVKRI